MNQEQPRAWTATETGKRVLIALFALQALSAIIRLSIALFLIYRAGALRTKQFVELMPFLPEGIISIIALFVANSLATERAKGRKHPTWCFPMAIATILFPVPVFVAIMVLY